MKPMARKDQLLVEDLPLETFVYDARSHKAHCLNRTVAFVWKNSNGANTVADLASLLARDLGCPVEEAVVLVALKQLEKASLLEADAAPDPDIDAPLPSRRELARKVAAAGGAAFLLPAIASASAPVPSSAGSFHGKHGKDKDKGHGNGNGNGDGGNGGDGSLSGALGDLLDDLFGG